MHKLRNKKRNKVFEFKKLFNKIFLNVSNFSNFQMSFVHDSFDLYHCGMLLVF